MTVEGVRFPGPGPVRLVGEGLVLREWRAGDVPRMAELFDDPQVRRWTPLASPFDVAAAVAYLERAAVRRRDGSALQLAITEGGDPPLGEVLLFMHPDVAEVGWALGAAHRGRRLASRAVRVLLAWAAPAWGVTQVRALIEPGNVASERVAAACGFAVSHGAPVMVESRGRTVALTAWHLSLAHLPADRRVGVRQVDARVIDTHRFDVGAVDLGAADVRRTPRAAEPVTEPIGVAGEVPTSG